LIYSLGTWRVASLFVNEHGPGNIFNRIRELAGIRHDENGQIFMIPETFFAGLLSCVWCASLWVAGFWVVLDWIFPAVAIKLGAICAISAGAILVEKLHS